MGKGRQALPTSRHGTRSNPRRRARHPILPRQRDFTLAELFKMLDGSWRPFALCLTAGIAPRKYCAMDGRDSSVRHDRPARPFATARARRRPLLLGVQGYSASTARAQLRRREVALRRPPAPPKTGSPLAMKLMPSTFAALARRGRLIGDFPILLEDVRLGRTCPVGPGDVSVSSG